MLFPKKVKHRKWHRMRRNLGKVSPAQRGVEVSFGSHGLKAVSYGRISSNQIEAARKVVRRALGKTGRMWIRVFPDRPVTAKAPEVPMGKGKGDLKGYEVEIFPGRVMLEVDGVAEDIAREALRKGGAKLSVKTKISSREL